MLPRGRGLRVVVGSVSPGAVMCTVPGVHDDVYAGHLEPLTVEGSTGSPLMTRFPAIATPTQKPSIRPLATRTDTARDDTRPVMLSVCYAPLVRPSLHWRRCSEALMLPTEWRSFRHDFLFLLFDLGEGQKLWLDVFHKENEWATKTVE